MRESTSKSVHDQNAQTFGEIIHASKWYNYVHTILVNSLSVISDTMHSKHTQCTQSTAYQIQLMVFYMYVVAANSR